MSLKSFDKFCEKMILAEPGSEKEIFDERQKQIQTRLGIQSMVCFIFMMLVHCVVSDFFCKWSESNTFPFLLFAFICLIVFIIRASVKGCYVGVNGGKGRYFASGICILTGLLNGFRAFWAVKERSFVIIDNGVIINSFLELFIYVLMIVTGILTIIFIKKNANENKEQS